MRKLKVEEVPSFKEETKRICELWKNAKTEAELKEIDELFLENLGELKFLDGGKNDKR